MHTTELEKLAALPLVQDALRAQAEATESEALQARLTCLDAYQQTRDEMATLSNRTTELDATQAELDRQRDGLAKQRAALEIERQQTRTRQSAIARELHRTHGVAMVVAIATQLDSHANHLRREIDLLRSLRERKMDWPGRLVEKPLPSAEAKAGELERQAEAIEQARDAIMAIQYARVSPQALGRNILNLLQPTGFNLNTTQAGQTGWRAEGWKDAPELAKQSAV